MTTFWAPEAVQTCLELLKSTSRGRRARRRLVREGRDPSDRVAVLAFTSSGATHQPPSGSGAELARVDPPVPEMTTMTVSSPQNTD